MKMQRNMNYPRVGTWHLAETTSEWPHFALLCDTIYLTKRYSARAGRERERATRMLLHATRFALEHIRAALEVWQALEPTPEGALRRGALFKSEYLTASIDSILRVAVAAQKLTRSQRELRVQSGGVLEDEALLRSDRLHP